MTTPLQPTSTGATGIYGVIRQSEVDDSLIPDGAVTESVNFHFDSKGVATVRTGIKGLGATVISRNPMPCYGLHNALSGTALVVFNEAGSSAIYAYDGSAWNLSVGGGTASVAIRFLDFGSCTIALNFSYNTYTSIRFIDGSYFGDGASYWQTSGVPINPDQFYGRACTLGEVFKSRVYLSGDTSKEGNPSRLYFSSVISTAGNITWDRSTDFVDINPGDGEGVKGLKRYSLELLIFKPNYIYRFRTSGVDPDPLIKIGTRSQESIVEGEKGLYFHHDSGFYRYSGGYPIKISRPISDIVEAIPFSQFPSIVSWNDPDHIYWSVGSVTIQETKGSVTIKNCVVRYTESSEVWTVYSYANEIRRAITFNSGTALTRIAATDHGCVGTLNSGNTDFGEPLKYRLRTKWYEVGGIVNRKILHDLAAICEKAQASEVMYQVDEEREWKTLGTMKEMVNVFKNQNIKCHRIRFLITGVSRFESAIFHRIEILSGINEGVIN